MSAVGGVLHVNWDGGQQYVVSLTVAVSITHPITNYLNDKVYSKTITYKEERRLISTLSLPHRRSIVSEMVFSSINTSTTVCVSVCI